MVDSKEHLYKCPDCGWIGTEDDMRGDAIDDGEGGEFWSNWICPQCDTWHQLNDYEKINDVAKPQPDFTYKSPECGYDESIHGSIKHPHPGKFPPIHFEMVPDVEEIAKANARLEMKREHNQYLASSGRVDGFYQEFLDMFDQLDNPTRQTKLEFLQALSLTQRHIIDQLIREQIRENTSTEVD